MKRDFVPYHPPFEPIPAFAGMATPFLILLLLWGCAGRNPITIPRTNAQSQLEERAYNTLLVSERLITEAEASNAAGTLPEFMRPIVNGLIDVHNEARVLATAYSAAINTDAEVSSAQALADLLVNLDRVISGFFRQGGGP